MPPREYGFFQQLGMSHGVAVNAAIGDILTGNIPGAWHAEQSELADDRNGTDWWVERVSGSRMSVDCKIRDTDWSRKGADDLALETWSVVERNKAGWTRDETKNTDYILWFWQDTGRWCLIPFPLLCGSFTRHWEAWRLKYKTATQTTRGRTTYHSECVFVPRSQVWRAIYEQFGGDPANVKQRSAT